jgi:hypothetical protein
VPPVKSKKLVIIWSIVGLVVIVVGSVAVLVQQAIKNVRAHITDGEIHSVVISDTSSIKSPPAQFSDSQIEQLYSKYCNAAPMISYKNTDYSADLIAALGKASIGDLTTSLMSDKYTAPQIPEALYYVGFKLTQASNVDDSLRFYKCAAEKYYDMQAMYRMASIYKSGTDGLKSQLPNAVINSPISVDYKQSYFWISSLIYAGTVEKTSFLDTSTTRGWNSIALLDDLQNTGKLSSDDMLSIENDVRTFMGKRYPQILNSDSRVINHKL